MKFLLCLILLVASGPAFAQAAGELSYVEIQHAQRPPEIFGFAIYKICEIKQYMVPLAYILAGLAFAFHVMKGLFSKFDGKALFFVLLAVFSIATADYFVAFAAGDAALYCPTALGSI
jgi:hypothetical protein